MYQQINNPGPQSITDYEASRPPSALTSYSNFHGQRRPNAVLPQQNKPLIGNQLTQESFNQFEEKKMNARYSFMKFYVMGTAGMHLFGIAHAKVDFFGVQKILVTCLLGRFV